MKKNLMVFETVFAAGIMICILLPSAILAKPHQGLNITIRHSDTVINGTNINQLPSAEHTKVIQNLKAIQNSLKRSGR